MGEKSILWFEEARLIEELRPAYVLFENSPEILKRGFEKILYSLSEIGYHGEWQCLSGTTFGIQQGRERIYFIAYSEEIRLQRKSKEPIFRESLLQESVDGISPGWRTRRDIPSPRSIRSAYDVPNLTHRIKALGNAVMPKVAKYLYRCIKYDFENLI